MNPKHPATSRNPFVTRLVTPVKLKQFRKKCDLLQEKVKLLFEFFAAINISSCLHPIMHESKWSHKSSFNQNKPHQFALRSSVLNCNQVNVSKHKFDQTWRIVYTYSTKFRDQIQLPRCKRLTNQGSKFPQANSLNASQICDYRV